MENKIWLIALVLTGIISSLLTSNYYQSRYEQEIKKYDSESFSHWEKIFNNMSDAQEKVIGNLTEEYSKLYLENQNLRYLASNYKNMTDFYSSTTRPWYDWEWIVLNNSRAEFKLDEYDCTQFSKYNRETLIQAGYQATCVTGYWKRNPLGEKIKHTWVILSYPNLNGIPIESTTGTVIPLGQFKEQYTVTQIGVCE